MTSWARRRPADRPDPAAPPRAAVLSPGPRGWLGLEQVRGLRVAVEQGALVVRRPDGRVERRAEPGEVTRLSLHTGGVLQAFGAPSRASGGAPVAEHGLLVVEAGDRPVLALWVTEWVPGPATGLTEAQARRMSGVDALAAALGLPVEAGDSTRLRRTEAVVRDAVVVAAPSPSPRDHLRRQVGVAALVLWALSFFAVGVHGAVTGRGSRFDAPWFFVVCWVGVAAAAGLLLADARSWRAAERLLARSPATGDDAWRPRPSGPVPAGFLAQARLLVRPDEVVVRDADGREAWLPGPAHGGVTRTATTDDVVVLVDARGDEHLALPLAWWAGAPGARAQLERHLAEAGLAPAEGLVTRSPVFGLPVVLGPMTLPWFGDARESTGTTSTNVRAATAFVALAAGLLSLGSPGALRPVGLVLGVVGVLAAAAQAVLSLRRGLRARAARRGVAPEAAA